MSSAEEEKGAPEDVPESHEGTTFLDAPVGSEHSSAVLAESAEATPFANHLVTEVRKLLVPIVTTLFGFVSGGGLAAWRGESQKEAAVHAAVHAAQEEMDEARASREAIRDFIRAAINARVQNASWDEVGSVVRELSPEDLIEGLESGKVDAKRVNMIAVKQIETAQIALPHGAMPDNDTHEAPDMTNPGD